MRGKSLLALSVIGLFALIVIGISVASVFSGNSTDLPWSVVGSSGNSSSSANHQLGSTSGQSSIGVSSSDSFELCAGFWCGVQCPDDNDGLTRAQEALLGTDPCVNDTDQDGCSDGKEVAPKSAAMLGGGRNPLYFWDFFDPNRDKAVAFADFLIVLRHFGSRGDPALTKADINSAEPADGDYWVLADRGGQIGANGWNQAPANGSIAFADFLALLVQFGHSCA